MRTTPRAGAGAPRRAALAAATAMLLSGCGLSVYDLPLPGGADLGDDPVSITVQFRDVLDLVPKSAVKVDDVTVGRVDSVALDGYTAEVRLSMRRDVRLPDNAVAQIRQTSLLGEKFVSLGPPGVGAARGRLQDGDTIPLARTGRNPEVEEVLGALSLVLNGGGVAQLRTISRELGTVLEGREGSVRSVLRSLGTFMGQLDANKADIVTALERVNRLAVTLDSRKGDLELALDDLPAALGSIDRQRDDLVEMLDALSRLGSVATDVVRAAEAGTVESLEALAPVLTELAKAGDHLPRSLQILLTYPFMDAVVGTNPQQARDLHMGDYTNLAIDLDLDLRSGQLPGLPDPPGQGGQGGRPGPQLPVPHLPLPSLPVPTLGVPGLPGLPGGGDGGDDGGGLLDLPGVGRVAPGARQQAEGKGAAAGHRYAPSDRGRAAELAAVLMWGMVRR